MGTCQRQAVDIRVRLCVLSDVPILHPRSHDAKWERRLGNLDDGEHVWVGDGFASVDFTIEGLVQSTFSTPLINKIATYSFYFAQADWTLRSHYLNAYRLPMIISLPKIRESFGRVVRGFTTQLCIWEDP